MKTCVSYNHHFKCKNHDRLLVLRLNKLERSNETPIHHFVCKFEKNFRTIRRYPKIKICMSCRYRFECESDKILALSLNKLERSNTTLNHHFICKFD